MEDLVLREEEIDYSLQRRIIDKRNVHLPWLSPQRSEAGGVALAILQALEGAAHCSVNFLGKTKTYNYESYNFDLKDYNNHTELLKSKVFIKLATGCEGYPFLEFNRGVLAVQFSLPQSERTFPRVDNSAWIGNSRQQILFPIGVNSDSKLETIPVDQGFSHVLITGGTRSGKSLAAQSAIQFLARRHTPFEFGFSIIEVKNSPTFRPAEWERYPHCMTQVANDHKSGIGVLLWYLEESYMRGEILKEAQCDTLDQYNAKATQPLPHLFCFIDEALSYLDPNSAPPAYRALFIGLCTELAVKAASVGIHLVMLVQRAGANDNEPFHYATTLRSNVGALRICFKVQTANDGRIALNITEDEEQHEPLAGEAAHLLGFGDGICRNDSGDLIRFQALQPIDPTKEPPFNSGGISIEPAEGWDDLPPITEEIFERYLPQRGRQRQMQATPAQASQQPEQSGGNHREIYEKYRALREGTATGKPISMSKSIQTIGGLSSDGGDAIKHWRRTIKDAVKLFLSEWLNSLPSDLPADQVVDRVWSMKAADKDEWIKLIESIRG